MVLNPNDQVPQSIIDQWNKITKGIQDTGIQSNTGQTLVAPGAITVQSLTNPVKPIETPPAPVDTNADLYSGIINSNSYYSAPDTNTSSEMPSWVKSFLDSSSAPTNPADTYNTLYNQSGIEGNQNLVNESQNKINALKAQLEGINAETTQAGLKLREEGISAGAISGRNIANERQAAIRALPIQAQVLAEQATLTGNVALLDQAKEKLNLAFKLQSDYEQKLFDYNQKKIETVWNYANDLQKEKLAQKKLQQEQDFQIKRDEAARQHDIEMANINQKNDVILKSIGLEGTTNGTIAGGVGGGNGNIVVTPTGQQTDISPLNDSFSYATTNFTKDQRTNAQATYNGFINRGDVSGAEKYVEKLITDKLSSTQKDAITTMGTVETQINKILSYNADGKLEGVGFFAGPFGALTTKVFGTGSTEAKEVRALIGNIKGTVAKLRGGTSFTPNEEKLLESYTPTINESAPSVITKLNLLKDFISTQRNKTLYPFGTQSSVGSDNNSLRTKYNY